MSEFYAALTQQPASVESAAHNSLSQGCYYVSEYYHCHSSVTRHFSSYVAWHSHIDQLRFLSLKLKKVSAECLLTFSHLRLKLTGTLEDHPVWNSYSYRLNRQHKETKQNEERK